jgi:uncharacterized protein YcaQ
VQLDTISVLARSHELVAYARSGPVGRNAVEKALWGGATFEYWAHAACVLPLADWPLFGPRRSRFLSRVAESSIPEQIFKEVRAHLSDGPATANEMGGAKQGGPWWDWSETKRAVELLLGTGEVVCMSRRGFQRVYDLAERRVPRELLETDLTTAECHRALVALSGRHLGVATPAEIADYYRLYRRQVLAVLPDSGLVGVEVEGWKDGGWAHPAVLDAFGTPGSKRHRTTLLSPFDSLVWDRKRTERIFGLSHRLEAYVPASKRVHGYYAMPVLAGGKLVGRVDPGRRDGTFVAKRTTLGSVASAKAAGKAILTAARWVGAESVIIEQVEPPQAAEALRRAVLADRADRE